MKSDKAVKMFKAISVQIRLDLMHEIIKSCDNGICPNDLMKKFDITSPNLSFHLKELENAGFVYKERKGQFSFYKAKCCNIESLINFLICNCKEAKYGKRKTA